MVSIVISLHHDRGMLEPVVTSLVWGGRSGIETETQRQRHTEKETKKQRKRQREIEVES